MKKLIGLLMVVFAFAFSATVTAQPSGVNEIDRGLSERASDVSAIAQQAEGGNVTSLTLNGTSVTGRWQGFYGNITGTITLGDASGNTLYDWSLANPTGEIYAANGSSVTWSNIYCVNFSSDGTDSAADRYNADSLNSFVGYTTASELAKKDTVNGTFNQTFGDGGSTLEVGDVTIDNAANCSMVTLFDDNGYQTSNYEEVLLTDNLSIVFAAILEQDLTGFNGVTNDFQMIVGVNGTGTPRDYFFYVELS